VSRKRDYGDGTIRQRTSGRWEARLPLGYDENGRRRHKVFYGKTRRDVQQKLGKARRDHHRGLEVEVRSQTVGQFLARWLNDVAKPSVRPSTYAFYALLTNRYLIPSLGNIKLDRLSPQHVQAMLNSRTQDGLSPRSVHHLRAVLRAALNQAIDWGLILRNVATVVHPPRVPHSELRTLDPAEARLFLEAVTDDRLEALYTVALTLGLRQGEALGLSWTDVDLAGRMLTIRNALQRVDGKLRLVEPKSATSRRTIPLPDVVSGALRAHKARKLEERLRAGSRWRESGLVFTSSIGTPLNSRNVVRSFHRTLERAGLPHIRFHDLRHSCASLMLAQGISPRTVMETLGHSQIGLTLNTYSHVMPALMRDAADAMDRMLGARAPTVASGE
jgi:integrase